MLCRFLHRFPAVRYVTFCESFRRAGRLHTEEGHENNLPGGRARWPIHQLVLAHRALSASFFFQAAAHCAVGAFNASTICIIPGRKSRKARHRCDHPYLFTHDVSAGVIPRYLFLNTSWKYDNAASRECIEAQRSMLVLGIYLYGVQDSVQFQNLSIKRAYLRWA